MRPRLNVLISPGFVLGLALLLVNDHVLKAAWPGFVTGKLSDFAGLWVFPMFFAALLPRRANVIYCATAIAFVWWKLPASQPAVNAWNATPLFDIARVVDVTDLEALAVLPVSYIYSLRAQRHPTRARPALARSATALAMVASLFAFAATSSIDSTVPYIRPAPPTTYYFDEPAGPIIERFNRLGLDYEGQKLDADLGSDFTERFWIAVPSRTCGTHFDARIEVNTLFETYIELQLIRPECDAEPANEVLWREFEDAIIQPLRDSRPPIDPLASVQRHYVINPPITHQFRFSRNELMDLIDERVLTSEWDDELERPGSADAAVYWIPIDAGACGFKASVKLEDLSLTTSSASLGAIHPMCLTTAADEARFIAAFEENFIAVLRRP